MKINIIKKDNAEYIVVDNFYNNNELLAIKKEINYLLQFKVENEILESAEDKNGSKRKGSGLWVDAHFSNRNKSSILTLNRKLFNTKIYNKSIKINLFFKHLLNCNVDFTLLNFYCNKDYYKPHIDNSILTALTMFKIGEFKGGDINFSEINEKVTFKENRLVIFPGCLTHEAEKIIAEPNVYRITIAQFLNYKT